MILVIESGALIAPKEAAHEVKLVTKFSLFQTFAERQGSLWTFIPIV
jgi:hypothetical protein